jgi:hypothetical protein
MSSAPCFTQRLGLELTKIITSTLVSVVGLKMTVVLLFQFTPVAGLEPASSAHPVPHLFTHITVILSCKLVWFFLRGDPDSWLIGRKWHRQPAKVFRFRSSCIFILQCRLALWLCCYTRDALHMDMTEENGLFVPLMGPEDLTHRHLR